MKQKPSVKRTQSKDLSKTYLPVKTCSLTPRIVGGRSPWSE